MSEEKQSIFQREIKLGKAFSDKSKESFYNELGSLLESGIDIQRSLNLLTEEQTNKRVKAILTELESDLVSGSSLSESMSTKGNHFSSYEYQSIRIGEETGRLKIVLRQLAIFFEDKVKLRRQLIGVFTYPGFVLLITIGVLYFMLSSVVPMFEDVFKQFGQELPSLTQKIIWLSNYFSLIMLYFFLAVTAVGIYVYTQRNEESYRKFSSGLAMRIPVFGPLIRKVYLARMCQSLSLLLGAKTPLVTALELMEEMIDFYPIEAAVRSIKEDIKKGGALHEGMAKFSIFDKRMVSLVKIAEEINQLDTTFDRLSKQYQEDIEYRTKLIGTIVEPAIIVVIGLIVGIIMVSMYLPMFNLSNVIK
ncbi:type II secretion system F family protein [Crocinitomicaceae bacterium CZZ-1]|uniref:Type II secretion system F family protein n=1 Tax=Taishania pollutisoli TaxID=2766479 RepID=A0A8J6P8M5_9FLAO|nr:type II secretion system F family protein [Taishania pollutisoli]MBC9813802.1 type II secretion system F family protein [Taishania pollutisoli]